VKINLKLLLCAAALSFAANNTSAMEDPRAVEDEALITQPKMTMQIKQCQEDLVYAGEKDEIEKLARLLKESRIDVNKIYTYGGWPLLVNASMTGRMSMVEFLLNQGADANIANNDGQTSLFAACTSRQSRHKDIAELLLTWGADVNRADKDGQTSLLEACIYEYCSTAELLLIEGADVNKANNKGWAPLHTACHIGNPPLVELLLNHGAYINIVNKKGETPLSIAKKREKHEAVAILLIHPKMPFFRFIYGCGYIKGQNFTDDNVAYSLKRVLGSHDLKRTITGYI
jgi:ankyrin repeat protein